MGLTEAQKLHDDAIKKIVGGKPKIEKKKTVKSKTKRNKTYSMAAYAAELRSLGIAFKGQPEVK